MPQESTALTTDNAVNNSASGFLPSLGSFLSGLVQPATDIYSLQLQGDILKNQYTSQTAAADAAAQQAAAQQVALNNQAAQSDQMRQWIVWGGIGLGVIVVLSLILRGRK